MGDTIKEFILFVTNNPLMLGLCIAIVVLFIILIIVLFSGKKTTTSVVEEKSEPVNNDEKEKPLVEQTNIDNDKPIETDAPSENAFTVDNIQSTFDEINKENAEAEGPALFTEEEAPINIDEVMNLKDKVNNENNGMDELVDKPIPTAPIPVPVELKKEPDKVEAPVIPLVSSEEPFAPPVTPVIDNTTSNNQVNNEFDDLLKEINTMKTTSIKVPIEENNPIEKDTNFQSILPPDDLEKTIIAEPTEEVNLNKLFDDDSFLNPGNADKSDDKKTIDNPEVPEPPSIPESVSSVSIDNTNTNIFDTDYKEEPPKPSISDDDEEVNLDDIELPKFKEESSDVLDNLKGESFNIE